MKQVNIIAFLVFLGAVAWIFLLSPDTVAAFRSTFLGWFSPVIKASGAVQSDGAKDQRSRKELLDAIAELDKKVVNLEFRQQRLLELERENEELREALDFRRVAKYDITIPALVIKRTRLSWWSTVTINRGTRHGLEKDLPVITRDNAVVGKITPNGLTKDTAEVLLLTDEQCWVAARIGRSASMHGLVHGVRAMNNFKPEIRLTFIDKGQKDVSLAAGAVLYTDDIQETIGKGQVYPPNLLIGTIMEQLRGDKQDSARVQPAADFANLKSVFVIKTDAANSPPPVPNEETDNTN